MIRIPIKPMKIRYRTGKTLCCTMEDELNVALMDYYTSKSGQLLYLFSFGGWVPAGGALKNGHYAVIRLLPAVPVTANLNLYSRKYQTTLYNSAMYYTKAARAGLGFENGRIIDAAALPEPGMQALTATVR